MRALGQNLFPFLAITLVYVALMIVLEISGFLVTFGPGLGVEGGSIAGMLGRLLPVMILMFLLGCFYQGAILFGALRSFKDDHRGIASSCVKGFRKVLPLAGVNLVIIGAMLSIGICVTIMGAMGGVIGLIGLIGGGVATVMLACIWSVAAPALVVEKKMGVFSSLQRSVGLTRGYRLWISGLLVAYVVFSLSVGWLFGRLGFDGLNGIPGLALGFGVNAVLLLFTPIGAASIYYELRFFKR